MNMGIQILLLRPYLQFFQVYTQKWKWWIIWLILCLIFWRTAMLFSIMAISFYILTNRTNLSTSSPTLIFCFFDSSLSNRCEIVLYCSFDLYFPMWRKLNAKNWCFWTVVLENTLESPLDYREIQPVHPKGDQSWVFIGRTDAEAETPVLWPPDARSWLIGKDPDAGRDWGQEKGTTEDEMAGWHHRLNGHECE